jgi:hypothetical protein
MKDSKVLIKIEVRQGLDSSFSIVEYESLVQIETDHGISVKTQIDSIVTEIKRGIENGI